MKKLLALLLALIMVLSLVACGDTEKDPEPNKPEDGVVGDNNAEDETPDDVVTEPEEAPVPPEEILANIWSAYPEDLKPMTFGGDYENNVENEPHSHTIADGGEELDGSIGYPADMIDKISEAAALRHMMNVNSFTCGAYILNDTADAQAVCDGIYNNLMNRSYLCGAPQWIVVMVLDGRWVINVFGAEDLVYAFRDTAVSLYGDNLSIVYDETMDGAHGDNGIDMGGLNIGIGF